MLGLSPRPEKTDLKAVVTGKVEREKFTVEKVHFQSRPRAVRHRQPVSAEEPRQAGAGDPLPLRARCGEKGRRELRQQGHLSASRRLVRRAWLRVPDHRQLAARRDRGNPPRHAPREHVVVDRVGYTPAGVEAWNCIRALDYLETRPEVDRERMGATGRSGGGAYSWWIAALDDRIKAAAPVAGDHRPAQSRDRWRGRRALRLHVHPRTSHRWDYAQVAALVAPRPLLIANTDSDNIFPLDGVLRVHDKT